MKIAFPGVVTIGNLLCGFLALLSVVRGLYVTAAWWIIIAALLDALDGKVARLTGGTSPFGVEFDSIADIVSFGAAPALLLFFHSFDRAGGIGYFAAFLFLAAGAVRLARFNVSATTEKKGCFTGMPIPSGACILASFVLFGENVWSSVLSSEAAFALAVGCSFAMVSRFKYNALPHLSVSTPLSLVKTAGIAVFAVLLSLYPDELFFPTGIVYLFSGPAKAVYVPAYEHVIDKVLDR